jgi:alkylation response protein AidB-like acyl-CoA dehydrogenase
MSAPANWFDSEPLLAALLRRQLGETAFERARPRLWRMGEMAAGPVAELAAAADKHTPVLERYTRDGAREDRVVFHPSYWELCRIAYGGGTVAATHDPALAPERGDAPHALTFALGYLYGQGESGVFCPVCMTDGAARVLSRHAPELARKWVPRLASMDLATLATGAMFLPERAGGSDVGRTETVAEEDPAARGTWRLTGQKWFCSNVNADCVLTLARPRGAGEGTRGLALFLLRSREGVRIERLKDKLGVRSMATGEVELAGAPADMVGEPGQGFKMMAEMMNLSRLYNSVAAVGIMRRALTEAVAWCRTRVAFGRPVAQQPLAREQLCDLAAEQRAALRLVFRAIEHLDRADHGSEHDTRCARIATPIAKLHTGKLAVWAASEGMELLGGNGYIEDWPMARLLRDAQVLPIWEGTSNIQVLDVLRSTAKERALDAVMDDLAPMLGHAALSGDSPAATLAREVRTELSALASAPGEIVSGGDAGLAQAMGWARRLAVCWELALLLDAAANDPGGPDERAALRVANRNLRPPRPGGMYPGKPATNEDLETLLG